MKNRGSTREQRSGNSEYVRSFSHYFAVFCLDSAVSDGVTDWNREKLRASV